MSKLLLPPSKNTSRLMSKAQTTATSYAPETWKMSIFGISMEVPGEWEFYPDFQGQTFSFGNGFIKFEEKGKKRSESVSVGVRWQTEEQDADNRAFMARYAQNMEAESNTKKRKKSIRIIEKKIIDINDHKAIQLICEYTSNPGLFGLTKKSVTVSVVNVAFYDEKTKRIIIGTAVAQPKRLEEKREQLLSVLYSLKSEDYGKPLKTSESSTLSA